MISELDLSAPQSYDSPRSLSTYLPVPQAVCSTRLYMHYPFLNFNLFFNLTRLYLKPTEFIQSNFVQCYILTFMNYNYRLTYMNQPLRIKKGKQGALYGIKVQSQYGFGNRISSRAAESQSHTPRVSVKKHKTPVKLIVNEKQHQNNKNQPTKQSKSSKSISKSFYDNYQSSCLTMPTPTTLATKCKSCQVHQQQYNQLSQTLRKYEQDQRQLKGTVKQLRQSYQKSLRKYKVKSKIQRDELRLLKWILSQRKQFHLILQQLQEMKLTRYKQLDELGKENLDENTCATDRSLIEKQKSQQINHNILIQPHQTTKTETKMIQTSSQKRESTSREMQMLDHINVLEQRVMELTVKNDFLERLKMKEQRTYAGNANSVHHMVPQRRRQQVNIAGQSKSGYHHPYYNQYSIIDNDDDDDEITNQLTFDRQLFTGGSANNRNYQSQLLVDSLYGRQKRGEVESRYVSPFKQRGSDKHNRDFHKHDQRVINDAIPESRSRYYDSIKERSRLLQL